ncbi:MAG: dolichyl-phosphate beta-D-mannosyltransferase [Pseudomonadota bacterium]|nr:MAG: dolichyl-phosphate beta-D-mannosyltransferase [Pseudomonadota bacterium]
MLPLVIIPTYNERENLIPLIDAVQSNLPSGHALIVDDNSPDGTGKLAAKRAREDPLVHVMHRQTKEGRGPGLISPVLAGLWPANTATFLRWTPISATTRRTCRGCWRPPETPISHLAAVGCRAAPCRGGSFRRLMLSRLGNLYARIVLSVPYRDLTGGFKCFRRHALQRIDLETIVAVGYGFQIETTWRALQTGLSVSEVPIVFTDRVRGDSKMSLSTFNEALGLVWRLRMGG